MLDFYDYLTIKEIITEQKKPLFIETKEGRLAICLTKEACSFYQKKGFASITLDKLFEIIFTGKNFEEQKELVKLIKPALFLFLGRLD